MIRLLPVLCGATLAVLAGCGTGGRISPAETYRSEMDDAIALSRGYLARAAGPDGRFLYKTDLSTGDDTSGTYNMLRHAGAVYAMGMCQSRWPDDATQGAMGRAARYLAESSVGPVEGETGLLAVWSRPEVVGEDTDLKAKLGGAGLGLVALLSAEAASEPPMSTIELRQLGLFILFMQNEDGSFVSRYNPEDGKDASWDSLYYPGEAALGLLMLYEHDPQPEWLQGAADALEYLALSREGESIVPADHWALLATAKLLPLLEQCPRAISRELLVQHAVQVCESMLGEYHYNSAETPIAGCFTNDGRTTPTATRLEGLLAALSFLSASEADVRARIEQVVPQSIAFLLGTQIKDGEYRGGIPRAALPLPDSHPSHSNAFNRRHDEIRIDYVQHALSAFVQYRDLIAQGDLTWGVDGPD